MAFLKQSTAITLRIGPFVDKTDGVTEETGLAATGTEISKAGGAFAAGPALGTHDSDGWYPIALTTGNTDTLGSLMVKVHDAATHLPVWQEHFVLAAQVFDSLFAGTDLLDVSMTQIAGAAVSTSTAQLGVNVVQAGGTAWGSGAITAASIATGAVDADALAADAVTEIWAGSTFPSSSTIAGAVWNEDATGHQTQGTFGQVIGDSGADTDSIWSLANTNLDTTISSRASAASVAAVQTDVDDIQARLPAALVGGRIDASVGAMAAGVVTAAAVATNAIDADALAADAVTEIWAGSTVPSAATIAGAVWNEDATGHQTVGTFGQVLGDSGADTDSVWSLVNANLDATVSSRATQTSVNTIDDFVDTEVAAIKAVTDALPNGGALTTIQADLDNIQTRLPAALVGGRMDSSVGAMAADTLTASALAADAVAEIAAAITVPTAGAVANAVWDLDATAHQTQGTFGQVLGDSGADTDSVWGLVNTNLNATISSRSTQTSVDAIAAFVDTEVAAIKAVTDLIPNGGALTTIQADLDNIQTRLPAALVGGRIDASVGAMAADTLTASALATTAVTEIWAASTASSQASVDAIFALVDTEIAAILADTNELQTDWADGGRLDLILDSRASQASVNTVDTVVDAILVDTAEIGVAGAGLTAINLPDQVMNITGNLSGSVGSVGANGINAASLDPDVGTELADALLKRDMSAVTGESARSPINALRFLRNKWSITAGTLTVTKENDTTAAWTAALTSDPSADPITATDPA